MYFFFKFTTSICKLHLSEMAIKKIFPLLSYAKQCLKNYLKFDFVVVNLNHMPSFVLENHLWVFEHSSSQTNH